MPEMMPAREPDAYETDRMPERERQHDPIAPIRACLIPVGERPKPITIDFGNSLDELQALVGGYIEILSVRSDGIDFVINEDGLSTELPNRAIFADKGMEESGYLSQMDYKTEVQEGDLYTVLFGDVVAVRHDRNGELVSLNDADFEILSKEFSDPTTGIVAVQAIRRGIDPNEVFKDQILKTLERGGLSENARQSHDSAVSLAAAARDCREGANELSKHEGR